MNQVSYFEIQAQDPKVLVDFYKKVFDWNFQKDENVPIDYYRIEGAGIPGAILARPVKTPPMEYGTNAFTVSVEVEDFDKTSQIILAWGGVVALEKFAIPGKCYQGYFLDPDNNVFGIFEVDVNAK